ncbi:MAG: hypothetical protein LQ341_005203 [Variospora aurantia]|nr:MAG: hypothetical protein LQ341_005203 [Variospora aurantia]
MATTAASWRSLRGFIVLLISALLLLISVHCGLSPLNRDSVEDVLTHPQVTDKSLPVLKFQNKVGQSLSLQLDGRDTTANFSSSHIYSKGCLVHIKRAALFEDGFQASERHADEKVPPLSRWSDITWTIWTELSGNNHNLRHLGHDNTANLRAAHIIEYIFTKHGRSDSSSNGSSSDSSSNSSDGSQKGSQAGSSAGSSADDEDELDFPGLEFGIDTNEGQALRTPNGIGTATLLIDRARQLGKRELKVNIFTREDGQYCTLWDMAPIGQPSTSGQGGKKHRVREHGFRHKL